MQQLRLRAMRRLPITFGRLTKRGHGPPAPAAAEPGRHPPRHGPRPAGGRRTGHPAGGGRQLPAAAARPAGGVRPA